MAQARKEIVMSSIGDEELPVYHLELVRDRTIPLKNSYTTNESARILHAMLDRSPVEQFVVLYVGPDCKMLGAETITVGDLMSVQAPIRSIFRGAIHAAVPTIVLGHNHPSTDPYPSEQDITLTSMAVECGELLGIHVIDHVVVSPNGLHYSIMVDHGQESIDRMNHTAIKDYMKKVRGSNKFVDPYYKKPSAMDIVDSLKKMLPQLPYDSDSKW